MSADALVLHEPRAEFTLDVELIKRTICKGATDDELALFISQCRRTGLDPFAKQIYAMQRWDSSLKRNVMQVQIGIDGFRLIADRTGRYVPGREPTFQYDKSGNLLSATSYVKVFRHGVWHECASSAMYSEYVQMTREGTPNSMWGRMPHSQLAKCAESLCLRKAFPAELSGLYTSDEMGQAENVPTVTAVPTVTIANGETVDTETGEIHESEQVVKAPPNFRKTLVKGCVDAYKAAGVKPTVQGVAMALEISEEDADAYFICGKFDMAALTYNEIFRLTYFAAHGSPLANDEEAIATALATLEAKLSEEAAA